MDRIARGCLLFEQGDGLINLTKPTHASAEIRPDADLLFLPHAVDTHADFRLKS